MACNLLVKNIFCFIIVLSYFWLFERTSNGNMEPLMIISFQLELQPPPPLSLIQFPSIYQNQSLIFRNIFWRRIFIFECVFLSFFVNSISPRGDTAQMFMTLQEFTCSTNTLKDACSISAKRTWRFMTSMKMTATSEGHTFPVHNIKHTFSLEDEIPLIMST